MNCFVEIYRQWLLSIGESGRQNINVFENLFREPFKLPSGRFYGWEPFKRLTLGPGYEEMVEGLEITQENLLLKMKEMTFKTLVWIDMGEENATCEG